MYATGLDLNCIREHLSFAFVVLSPIAIIIQLPSDDSIVKKMFFAV